MMALIHPLKDTNLELLNDLKAPTGLLVIMTIEVSAINHCISGSKGQNNIYQ